MNLPPGSHLGPYEIVASLGAGGMGEVYRARDHRLARTVAIKILPSLVASHPDRLKRFEREARLLAALNHPHIAAIYGVEEADSPTGPALRALILELVEGPTLSERLAHGPLPLKEALPVARQLADALEAAHAKGIVHRDVKPGNIKLTANGTVKVLDFGIAKALETPDASGEAEPVSGFMDASTVTMGAAVIGTAAYMSPEQARGQPIDKRADVWAFGCVLYEMLTGRRAFSGQSVPDTLAAVLEREPDWTVVSPDTPESVRRVLRRALAKDPSQRLRDMGDIGLELNEAADTADESRQLQQRTPWQQPSVLLSVAAALALGLVVGMLVMRSNANSRDESPAVTRTTVMLPGDQELDVRDGASPLALSPDGRRLAYVASSAGQRRIYVRRLDAYEATALAGTEGAHYPFFSPDGQSVAFFADGKLKRVSTQGGGSPVPLCETPLLGRGGTWGPDGTIVFSRSDGGLMRVPAAGGHADPITSQERDMDSRPLFWPQFLPDGRSLLVTAGTQAPELVVLSLETGTWRTLGPGAQAQYMHSGHLLFHAPTVREGELQIARFDAERLRLDEPVTVLDGIFRAEDGGGAYFSVSTTGALLFARGSHARTLVSVDRRGRRTPLADDRRGFRMPVISRDGRSVAVTIDPRPSQIWVYDLDRRTGIPLATDGHSLYPRWAPDGRRVVYTSEGDLYVRAADASGAAERLLARDRTQYAHSWSGDGSIVFVEDHSENRYDIWLMPVGGEPRPLLATASRELQPQLSPDQRWLAYTSDESGRDEVYVRPFPNVDAGKWLMSTGGGVYPVWAPSGQELFYRNGAALMVVSVETQGGHFRPGSPEVLFSGPFETGSPQFDVAPDGAHFVMVEADPNARPTQIHAVLNWNEELKRVGQSGR